MQNTALNPTSSSSSIAACSGAAVGATAANITDTSDGCARTIGAASSQDTAAAQEILTAVASAVEAETTAAAQEILTAVASAFAAETTTTPTATATTACNIVAVTPSSSSSASSSSTTAATTTTTTSNGHESKQNGFVANTSTSNNTANNAEAPAAPAATAAADTSLQSDNGDQNEAEMRSVDGENNHADGGSSSGGGDGDGSGEGHGSNTVSVAKTNVRLDAANQEIVRLIGQYLKDIGLEQSVDTLMAETGCYLEHPAATQFRSHVLSGEWSKADVELKELEPIIESAKRSAITEIKFLLLEQKYLENLDDGRPLEALHVLRNELTPLQHNISRVHQLSSYMMCANKEDLHSRAKWKGKGMLSRGLVMERLQTFLPPSLMMSPHRLRTLLQQAVELQTIHCPCHNIAWETNLQNVSLLTDHCCATDGFPMHTIQILSHHCDEVWFCKFSPDGLKLATGSKDATVIIWELDPCKLTLKHRRTLDNQSQTIVAFVNWSPDSKLLLVGGPEDTPEVCIWNVDDGKLVVKMSQSMEDSLTCGTFNRDGTRFVCGGQKGHFYLCDLNGGLIDSWEGVRVNSLAFREDNKTILASDNHYRVRGYTFDNARTEFDVIKEPRPIMSFTINSADRMALLNISHQGLHLWDLEDRCLVRRFQGIRQSNFSNHSCFGGVSESFVASGSEDKFVVIWHIRREEPLAKLAGHTKAVTCVSWNPVYTSLLASASDDATVRIWGPKTSNPNTTTESDDCSSCSSSSSWNMTS